MLKICNICNKEKPHYAKGLCRPCYRKETEEDRKYKESRKKDTKRYQRYLERNRLFCKQRGQTLHYKEWHRNYLRNKYKNDPKYRQHIKNWKNSQPKEKKLQWYRRDNATRDFSSFLLVDKILKKYDYKCAVCKMSNKQHVDKYKARLNLHHKNGLGRNTPRLLKDNREENLIPLCKSCHRKVEAGKINL